MGDMELQEFVDKILSYKTYSDKKKVDAFLERLAAMWAHTGTDSTKSEIKELRKQSRILYRGIKQVDPAFGDQLLRTQDK
jgi:hypothetical protein